MACVAELKSHLVKQIQVNTGCMCILHYLYIIVLVVAYLILCRIVYTCCNRPTVEEGDPSQQIL